MNGSQNNRLIILFVDQITFSSLLRVCIFGNSCREIWHFDPLNPFSRKLISIFRKLGLLSADVKKIQYHIGQVRNNNGEGEYRKLICYTRTICSRIKREQLAKDPLIKAMEPMWAVNKIIVYFEKLIEKEIQLECLRIGMVKWMMRYKLHIAPTQCILLIGLKKWFSYLDEHARSQRVQLLSYNNLGLGRIAQIGLLLLGASRRILPVLLGVIKSWFGRTIAPVYSHRLPDKSSSEQYPTSSAIAINCWYQQLSFDPSERSELFWLNGSGTPYSEVILYHYNPDQPLNAEAKDLIKDQGIRLFGRGRGIPHWHPTGKSFKILLQTLYKIISSTIGCLMRAKWAHTYFIRGLLDLAFRYSYWYDFYVTNRVIVNFGTLNTHVSQVLAMDSLSGVTVNYQYTAAIFSPSTLYTAGEDIQFVFSPVFEQLWRDVESQARIFVHTGFIFDSAIRSLHGIDRIVDGRKQLQDNGARFILCFLDENSSSRWNIYASHEYATKVYEYLLKWLLADPTLGLILKPKRPADLYQRINSISELIHNAKQCGRCIFMDSGPFYGIYPAEAALMADLCIGSAIGGTAALEARLAGVPTVLIESVGIRNPYFQGFGHGSVVFNDWEALRSAVEKYRVSPETQEGLGDWSGVLNNFDPFQDGQASLRIGLYVHWVYESLNQGVSKKTALKIATEKFAQRWGNGHITFRPTSSML